MDNLLTDSVTEPRDILTLGNDALSRAAIGLNHLVTLAISRPATQSEMPRLLYGIHCDKSLRVETRLGSVFRAISDAWDDFLDNNAEIIWGCAQFSQSCRDNAAAIIRDKVDACVLSVQTNYGRLWFRWLDVKSILYSASGLIRPAMFSCVWFGLVSSLLVLFSRHSVTVPECIDVANKPERGFGGFYSRLPLLYLLRSLFSGTTAIAF